MDIAELERLLRSDETDRVEKTVSLKDTDKFCEAICAFANDLPKHQAPGYLFVGARPDGTASGAAITDQLLQNLGALRSDGNIQPMPVMVVQRVALGGGEMAVVQVQPSDLPPVRYKQQVWIRVGPRRDRASEQEERLLIERRTTLAKTWDARPCRESSLDDLALELFTLVYRPAAVDQRVIQENHRSMEHQLAALRLFDLRAACPTNLGVLLLSVDAQRLFPGAYVQVVRFAGPTNDTDVVLDRRISGDLRTILSELRGLSNDLAGMRPAVAGTREQPAFAYPPVALQELLFNAVIHRDYEYNTPIMVNHFSDRVEIVSRGGLYELTEDEFPEGQGYRNPVLAEAARVLGFVNRYGTGIARAAEALKRNGSAPLEFKHAAKGFAVTVWARA